MDLQKLSGQMVDAYNSANSQGEAVEAVKDKNPEADLNILWAMWYAVDACRYFGALIVGANKLQRVMQVPSSFIIALNGLVVVFVVSADYWRRRMARRREAEEVGEMIESSEAEVPT